jgi:signal peptidase I
MMYRKKSAIREWVESILIAVILALFIRTFIVQAFKIPSGSMHPTLMEGDRILVNKFLYGAKIPFTDFRLPAVRQPQRSDVIVFIYPQNPKKDFIKRLIAVGGETVEIINGNIYIDGKIVSDAQIRKIYYYNRGEYGREGEGFTVPQNTYFVLGDNSASSHDSRFWGVVEKKYLIGKAFLIYWPPHRIRIIK